MAIPNAFPLLNVEDALPFMVDTGLLILPNDEVNITGVPSGTQPSAGSYIVPLES
jgi:hypothetical protein